MRSIFDGYLTDGCKDCPCWKDGSDGKSFGCAITVPIDCCPHFNQMMKSEEKEEKSV